ncbi:MAG: hypothetical protein WAW80_05255 [Candidatus Saccharimonadales bacterium]
MERSGLSRIVPIALIIIISGIAIFALFSVGRSLFSGDGANTSSPSASTLVNVGKTALTNTLADRGVRMIVRGPLVANENYRSYTITVNPDARNMTTYRGYMGEQIDSEQLTNNLQAYEQFVYALDHANLMEGTPLTGDANDVRGLCASGNIYEFEVLQGVNSIQKLWTSTCSGSVGSLKASLSQVTSLFRAQIPEYTTLASKIDISN